MYGSHFLQRQKAEAAEAQSSKLAGQLEKEQADNARSSAKLKGTEKHITDVLAQISTVKEMHHLLLQTLGEASDSIQTGGPQNAPIHHISTVLQQCLSTLKSDHTFHVITCTLNPYAPELVTSGTWCS